MNRARKIIALLLAALLLTFLPTAGFAASFKLEALKPNQWYSLRDYSDDMTIYRLKVTGETLVYFNWKGVMANVDFGGIEVYRDKSCRHSIADIYFSLARTGVDAFVFYPGTYYLQMYDEEETGKVKISIKKAALINKANYCLNKAINLKAGKKAEIAQTKKINYDRWYRIKLTKKQIISFYGLNEVDFALYDSNMNEIKCSEREDRSTTVGKQPRGNYYLRIYGSYYHDLDERGKYTAFSWK